MKKFCFLLAGVAAAASAQAADPVINSGIAASFAEGVQAQMATLPQCRELTPAQRGSSYDPENWTEENQGMFRDDIMRSAFDLPYTDFYARIQSSTHTPGLYRLVNPYQNYPLRASDLQNTNNMENWNFMILHTEHAPYVWFEDFSTGLSVTGLGTVTVHSQAAQLVARYGFDQVLAAAPSVFGKIEDGTITFPSKCTVNDTEYSAILVSVTSNPDQYVAVNDDGLWTYVITGEVFPPLPEGAVNHGFNALGAGKFTDGILSTRSNLTPEERDVEVFESRAMPGYYLVKNAWSQVGSDPLLVIDATEPDLVLLPPQDPAYTDSHEGKTYIVSHSYEEQFLAWAPVTKDQFIEQFPADVITLNNGVIDIPAGSVRYKWPVSEDPTTASYVWYTSRRQQASRLTFNPATGVDMHVADADTDAPAEYYTLQGIRVSNPRSGEILIRRQGARTAKVIIR